MNAAVLVLSNISVNFEPVSKLSDVFYDNVNKKVFTVRAGGAMGVTARGPSPRDVVSFRLADKGSIFSIKLSPDLKVIAVQRSATTVEFVNIVNCEAENVEYAQSCKGKNTRIVGIEWTGQNEILFVTDHGLELYQVITDKRTVKSIKVHNIVINWYVFSPETKILVVSSGTLGTVLQPFSTQPGNLLRLSKFEVELGFNPQMQKLTLLDRDVAVVQLYGSVYILVLRHMTKSDNAGAEVLLYLLNSENPSVSVRKSHVLKIGTTGKFAIHKIDDLIIVHQQASCTSFVFDIFLSTVSDGSMTLSAPVFDAHTIRVQVPSIVSDDPDSSYDPTVELYAPTWVVFQPDIIIDAKIGCMWRVCLNLEPCVNLFADKPKLFEFLLRRRNAKSLFLTALYDCLEKCQVKLYESAKIWDFINTSYKNRIDSVNKPATGEVESKVVIDQSDLYTHVFFPLSDSEKVNLSWFSNIIVEYLFSVQRLDIPVQPFIQELLVTSLVKCGQYEKLHQLVSYNVITESKPMAFLLLSLESQYPPALQLALDLLSKRNAVVEEFVEILLSKQKVLEALRYVQTFGVLERITPMKFVEAAWQTKDTHVFFTIFSYFEQQSMKRNGTQHFAKGDQYDLYLVEYRKLWNSSEQTTSQQSEIQILKVKDGLY